jgi:hypothetical protein
MIHQVKQNPFLTWVVGVEAGMGAFPPILNVAQIVPTMFQDIGGCPRLSTLSGSRRRFGPHAIYVSDLIVLTNKDPHLGLIFASDMPPNCRCDKAPLSSTSS